MKQVLTLMMLFALGNTYAQKEASDSKFYVGFSSGKSLSIGDFKDTDLNNPDAGFAKNGSKFDLYAGRFLNEKFTLIGTFRYQQFDTEIEDLIELYNNENPDANFSGTTQSWAVYYLLIGVSYQVNISKKMKMLPRIGIGPMVVNNPGITVTASNGTATNSFERTSESGFGMGYELGIGLRRDLGRHFSLMPTFTFSGGIATIRDVQTITDNATTTADYQPTIQSFTLGLSLAYRF